MELIEGAKISKQLVNLALKNPDISFGFEAELFYKGIDYFVYTYMNRNAEFDVKEEWYVKSLGNSRWHDVIMFFYPLAVPATVQQDNSEILKSRLVSTFVDVTKYDANYHNGDWPTESEMFAILRSELKMPIVMALLKMYPYNGMLISKNQEKSVKSVMQRGDVGKASTLGKLESINYRMYEDGWDRETFNIKEGNENIREVFYEIFSFQLQKYLGDKVNYAVLEGNEKAKHNGYDSWSVVPDISLGNIEKYEEDIIGIEIISPIMTLEDGLQAMPYIFNIIDNPGLLGFETLTGVTTQHTGFHINIGISNINEMDYVKLILLMGDHNAVAQYGRELSDAAAAILPRLITNVTSLIKYEPEKAIQLINQLTSKVGTSSADISNAINALASVVPKDKNQSVNLRKLPEGYVEFRHAGGSDYHKDFEKIRNSVLSFATWMYVATNEEIYKKEYYMAVFKLLQTIKTGESKYLPDDFSQQLDKIRNDARDSEEDDETLLDSIGATPNIGPTGRRDMEPTGYMDSMWVPEPDNEDGVHPGDSEDDLP